MRFPLQVAVMHICGKSMKSESFRFIVFLVAPAFTIFFLLAIVPALIQNFDVLGALAAGFVNPYSSGYSTNVIACWLILVVWIVYEKINLNINYSWVCALLGIVPGVAVGFAAYLILRTRQLTIQGNKMHNKLPKFTP